MRIRNPNLKIIFVSGYAEEAFDKSLPENEQFAFLAKAVRAERAGRQGQGDDDAVVEGRHSCPGRGAASFTMHR